MDPTSPDATPDLLTAEAAALRPGILIARGVSRGLRASGAAVLIEVTLVNGRRADVMALYPNGTVWIVEVKSSIEDFRADHKWEDYRPFCDALYFAVPQGFPRALIPPDCGLIGADPYFAEVVRPAVEHRLVAARRKAITLRFAQLAAGRLQRLLDPGLGIPP